MLTNFKHSSWSKADFQSPTRNQKSTTLFDANFKSTRRKMEVDGEIVNTESIPKLAFELYEGYSKKLEDIVTESLGQLHELTNEYYNTESEIHKLGEEIDSEMLELEEQMISIENFIKRTRYPTLVTVLTDMHLFNAIT